MVLNDSSVSVLVHCHCVVCLTSFSPPQHTISSSLWKILGKFGCPEKLMSLIASFHDAMQARVQENGDSSEPFPVRNRGRQGCILEPTLFSFLFSAQLLDAFRDCERGVYVQFRFSGKLFNLRRLQAKTKVFQALLWEFLFADDCALTSSTL